MNRQLQSATTVMGRVDMVSRIHIEDKPMEPPQVISLPRAAVSSGGGVDQWNPQTTREKLLVDHIDWLQEQVEVERNIARERARHAREACEAREDEARIEKLRLRAELIRLNLQQSV